MPYRDEAQHKADLLTAMPATTSPPQEYDISRDDMYNLILNIVETLFDGRLRFISDGGITRAKLDTNSVSSDAIITSGSHRAGPGLRAALENLTGSDRLPGTAVRFTASDGQGNLATTVNDLQRLANAVNDLQLGLGTTAVTNLIRSVVASMLTGNTETGISVIYRTDDNTIDFVVTGGGSTPVAPTHTRYAFWLPYQDTTPTVADITGGNSTTTSTVTIPAYPSGVPSGQGTRLGFGQLATENDLTTIEQQGSPFGNEFTDFTKGTVGTYEFWLSDDDRLPVTAGTVWTVT